jgi:membrane-associated phospholipid phosphatase
VHPDRRGCRHTIRVPAPLPSVRPGFDTAGVSKRPRWLTDAARVDTAIYAAVAATRTPSLDHAMRTLASAADRSRLWIGASALLATRGPEGRRAAEYGLASIGVASAVVNLALKPLARRRRPDRRGLRVPLARHVPMPKSRSLPSGHSASAFAFATGVAHVLPREGTALRVLAAVVAYSRVHTGVHFPGDVVIGSLVGTVCGQVTARALDAHHAP